MNFKPHPILRITHNSTDNTTLAGNIAIRSAARCGLRIPTFAKKLHGAQTIRRHPHPRT